MIVGQRILARLQIVGFSQAELARRVGMSQSAMHNLITGKSRSSTHLHKIARELLTTPAYMAGETDDPDDDAPPPPPAPAVQFVTMPVAWPSEPALEQMFEAFLEIAGDDLSRAELARELAQQLPIGLTALQGPLMTQRNTVSVRPRALATNEPEPQR